MLVEGISLHDPFSLFFRYGDWTHKNCFLSLHFRLFLFPIVIFFFSGLSCLIDLICLKIVSNCYRLIELPIVESLSANSTVLCCFVSLNVHFTVSLMFDFFSKLGWICFLYCGGVIRFRYPFKARDFGFKIENGRLEVRSFELRSHLA